MQPVDLVSRQRQVGAAFIEQLAVADIEKLFRYRCPAAPADNRQKILRRRHDMALLLSGPHNRRRQRMLRPCFHISGLAQQFRLLPVRRRNHIGHFRLAASKRASFIKRNRLQRSHRLQIQSAFDQHALPGGSGNRTDNRHRRRYYQGAGTSNHQ